MNSSEFVQKYKDIGRLDIILHDLSLKEFAQLPNRDCEIISTHIGFYYLFKTVALEDLSVTVWSEKILPMGSLKEDDNGKAD